MTNLRQFLPELGSDFTFVGERYRLQALAAGILWIFSSITADSPV